MGHAEGVINGLVFSIGATVLFFVLKAVFELRLSQIDPESVTRCCAPLAIKPSNAVIVVGLVLALSVLIAKSAGNRGEDDGS